MLSKYRIDIKENEAILNENRNLLKFHIVVDHLKQCLGDNITTETLKKHLTKNEFHLEDDYLFFDDIEQLSKIKVGKYTNLRKIFEDIRIDMRFSNYSEERLINHEIDRLVTDDISAYEIKKILTKSETKLSVLYFFIIGKVNELRDILNISDDFSDNDLVCKYGLTIDLLQRLIQHIIGFKKNFDVNNIYLSSFCCVDEEYLHHSETELGNYFRNNKKHLNHKKFTELVAIKPSDKICVKQQYKKLSEVYYTKMQNQINDFKHKYELSQQKCESQKDLISRQDNEKDYFRTLISKIPEDLRKDFEREREHLLLEREQLIKEKENLEKDKEHFRKIIDKLLK